MKTIYIISKSIITLLIITLFASCAPESFEEDIQDTTKRAIAHDNFKISPIKNSRTKNYSENYLINQSTTNIDVENDVIQLEIPIPLSDYSLLKVYNISSENNAAILYLVGRQDTGEVVDLPINYVIQDEISISELNLDTNLLTNGNGLRIFVMNNSEELDVDSEVYTCIVDSVDDIEINTKCTNDSKAADGPLIYNGGVIMD